MMSTVTRMSLIEQKKLQWAKEREEMHRLGGPWASKKISNPIRTTIRTYPNGSTRVSLTEMKETVVPSSTTAQPLRAGVHYEGTNKSRTGSQSGTTSLHNLDYCSGGGSLINLHDRSEESSRMMRRSPSLPPIYNNNKDQQQQQRAYQERDLGVEGSRYYYLHKSQKNYHHHHHHPHHSHRNEQTGCHDISSGSCQPYGSPREEREGETSGYASDSLDVPVLPLQDSFKPSETGDETSDKIWENPYCTTPENSLPPSRRLSSGKMELNRPRWGSVWAQETMRGDPPPPSWLERGLSRLDNNSQVLVVNHDCSASSPDSSTTDSTSSYSNKTYLRGQNIHVDADILQEREARRQKAMELQNAIKQQLEERDRHRKAEKERRLREEAEEEERIKRERDKEKERFEEEQRRLKEREEMKLKKAEAMRQVLEVAERLAKEDKVRRRRKDEGTADPEKTANSQDPVEAKIPNESTRDNQELNGKESKETSNLHRVETEQLKKVESETGTILSSVNKDTAIFVNGKLEERDDTSLSKGGVQFVNLVVTQSPRQLEDVNALIKSLQQNSQSNLMKSTPRRPMSPRIVENRILTPSKYRISGNAEQSYANARDFGTQTDIESKDEDSSGSLKDTTKERKDAANATRRKEVEKSTNTSNAEETTKSRSKSQPARKSIDSRPRWNANRPGTRYRTQSEKDPHYQRKLRLRRRRIETSDEGSRSPSPDRRKVGASKMKNRNSIRHSGRCRVKADNYDADLSMESLNLNVPPTQITKHYDEHLSEDKIENNFKSSIIPNEIEASRSSIWCGEDILAQLSSLKSGLLMKQQEWDRSCLISPSVSELC